VLILSIDPYYHNHIRLSFDRNIKISYIIRVILGQQSGYRAAAVEQLMIWGERVGVPVVKQKMGADPASVAYDTPSGTTFFITFLILVSSFIRPTLLCKRPAVSIITMSALLDYGSRGQWSGKDYNYRQTGLSIQESW